jgi:hypothetical protein
MAPRAIRLPERMTRPSLLLMFAGTAALLVALFLLRQALRSDDPAIPTTPTTQTTTQPAAPTTNEPLAAPARTATSPTAGRAPKLPPSTTGFAASPPAPAPAPSPAAAPTSGERVPLHGQTKAVEPLVRECVEKAMIAGARPTGTATLTYIVARRGDKLEIEDTGIDNEKTTIENEGLLECLHQTAKAMKFDVLPRDSDAILAARRVTLENGKITEYKHVTFSYLR